MALRQINLVPGDELEKFAQVRHLKFWFKCLVLVVALLGTVQGVQYRRISLLRSQLPLGRGINGINLQVNERLDDLAGLRKQVETIHTKQQSMATIVRSQVFYDIIASVAGCLNPDTWLDFFSTRRDEKDPDQLDLKCRGFALDHNALGHFLDRLSKTPGIHDLVLNDASHGTDRDSQAPNGSRVHFTLSCRMSRMADQ